MPFPFDIYPWANYQELNLAYFIARFQEIFRQWADLYDTMTAWQAQTDADLEAWKNGVISDINARETALRQELTAWKATIEQDISSWESSTLAALTAWQTAAETQFEAIRVQAAASATAAAGSAADAAAAKTAAETAQTAAEAAAAGITAELAQIQKNTDDITDLNVAQEDSTGNAFYKATATGAYIPLGSSTTDINNPTTSSTAEYYLGACSEGDQFTISTVGGSAGRAYGFVQSDGTTVISSPKAPANHTCDKELVTAPAHSAYIVVNAVTGHHILVYKNELLQQSVAQLKTRTAKSFLFDVLDSAVTFITANDDLDNFLIVGNYKKTITNGSPAHCPVAANISFGLKVLQIAASTTYSQILIPAAPSTGHLWYRMIVMSGGETRFGDWHEIADERDISELSAGVLSLDDRTDSLEDSIITHKNVILDSTNYLTYLVNGSFDDAQPNTIYAIDEDTANLLSNGPPGDGVTGLPTSNTQGAPLRTWGPRRGTLITYSQAISDTDTDGLTQIFIMYPGNSGASYHAVYPSISFRIAFSVNNVLTWSPWSKLAQDGVVHAGNAVVYGGSDYIGAAPFTDLDDAPWNGIFHIDRNINGSDADHTLAHHPLPGVSCMVVTFAFSPSFNHCRAQFVLGLNGEIYWRYEYLDHGEQWTAWRRVSTKIPEPPSTDGTYILKCTVSNSGASVSYSWVADT